MPVAAESFFLGHAPCVLASTGLPTGWLVGWWLFFSTRVKAWGLWNTKFCCRRLAESRGHKCCAVYMPKSGVVPEVKRSMSYSVARGARSSTNRVSLLRTEHHIAEIPARPQSYGAVR
jgi:hypothetical protein